MNISIKYILVCLLVVGFASCNSQPTSSAENKENALPKELYKLQDDFEYVNRIPYYKQTPEQKVISLLLMRISSSNIQFLIFTSCRTPMVFAFVEH